jgi:excisionase family DNA binding protein
LNDRHASSRSERPPQKLVVLPDVLMGRYTITVPEFADLVGIGRTAAYEAAGRNEIPVRRIGSRYVMPVALVMQWLGLADETGAADAVILRNNAIPVREDGFGTTGREI